MLAFRQRCNPLTERNRDMDGLYICDPSRRIKPLNGTQYATFQHWDHHHTNCTRLSLIAWTLLADRMAQNQSFQAAAASIAAVKP